MRIDKVKHLSEYKIQITFNNKEKKTVDLKNFLIKKKGILGELKNPELFKKVKVDSDHISIFWPNGADLCPDVLYDL